MKAIKKPGLLLLGAALASFSSTPVHAGACDVLSRPLTDAVDIITMSCRHGTAVGTTGEVGLLGSKITRAHLISGAAGSGAFAATGGLDASGNVIASCTVQDFTFGGDPPAALCTSGVRWVGTILHSE